MDASTQQVIRSVSLGKKVIGPEGDLQILQDVDLDIVKGEALAVVGASGSGKSTLLGLLAGLDEPSSGEVHLLGQKLNALDEDGRAALRLGRVGFVFQSFQLLPGLTALENVMLPMELSGNHLAAIEAKKFLNEVGLQARMHHYPTQLSGGEQQRVAIARAFADNPEVLFADEPTGNLDEKTGNKIIDLIFDLRTRYQITLVLVTHDSKLANRCDRSIHLSEGHVVEAE